MERARKRHNSKHSAILRSGKRGNGYCIRMPFYDIFVDLTHTIHNSSCKCRSFLHYRSGLIFYQPASCDDPENDCPCTPVGTAIAYGGTDPDTWAAELSQYNMILDSPVCFPNTEPLAGPTSTYCVCAGSSMEPAFYSTIQGALNQSACAYSASSDLPLVQFTPVTVPATVTTTTSPTSCSPTV